MASETMISTTEIDVNELNDFKWKTEHAKLFNFNDVLQTKAKIIPNKEHSNASLNISP